MKNPRIIFAGTPEFALASLRAIIDVGMVPIAVLTQPDRPAGRGKRMSASPVKLHAEKLGIDVLQPETLRDDAVAEQLRQLQPDLMVVAAYGLLLPQAVLDIPTMGCLNVHASLLPRWRGAAPIQAAILSGDETTGVCLMSMTAGLDCGPVYSSDALTIDARETAGELHDRLAVLGGKLLARNISKVLDGAMVAIEQDEKGATYAGKINSADAELDWRRPAADLQRLIRAYNPVPGAWFTVDNLRIKCWAAEVMAASDAPSPGTAPGTVMAADRYGIVIGCGDGALRLLSLQRPGKRAVDAREFAAQLELAGRCLG